MAIAIVSAPSNLGLRPPEPGTVPGAAKAPEALREAGLFARLAHLGAREAGVILPGRYHPASDPSEEKVRNQTALVDHARRLADRIGTVLDRAEAPLVIGGDCSILIGAGLALRRRGRYGLVHADGHTDFRHPGNSAECASLAGEDLAAAIGLHWPGVADLDGRAPYFRAADSVHVGCRDDDDELEEVQRLLGGVIPAREVAHGAADAVDLVRRVAAAEHLDGYWIHLNVDILDPRHLPAVDSPDPGGLSPERLVELLVALAPAATGAQVTVFDPDLDPEGKYAALLTEVIVAGLGDLGSAAPQPATSS